MAHVNQKCHIPGMGIQIESDSFVTNSEKRRSDENKEVFKIIGEGHTNLKIVDMTGLSYAEVLMYRIAYERRRANG